MLRLWHLLKVQEEGILLRHSLLPTHKRQSYKMGFMEQASSPARIMWKRREGPNCLGHYDVGRGGREARHREAHGAQGVMETKVRARI